MKKRISGLLLGALVIVTPVGLAQGAAGKEAKGLRVVSDQTATGLRFPESAAYDPKTKVLYVGQFGSKLAPAELNTLAENAGRVDGLYQMKDGMQPLAKDFKGPADFTVVPEAKGLLVVVPDLAKSELRLIRLSQ